MWGCGGWWGVCFFFFFNDTATTEIYTLSLHDALPIFPFEFSLRVLLSPLNRPLVVVKWKALAWRVSGKGTLGRDDSYE